MRLLLIHKRFISKKGEKRRRSLESLGRCKEIQTPSKHMPGTQAMMQLVTKSVWKRNEKRKEPLVRYFFSHEPFKEEKKKRTSPLISSSQVNKKDMHGGSRSLKREECMMQINFFLLSSLSASSSSSSLLLAKKSPGFSFPQTDISLDHCRCKVTEHCVQNSRQISSLRFYSLSSVGDDMKGF